MHTVRSFILFALLVLFGSPAFVFAADDHGNTCSTATAVTVNRTRGGAINPAGDIDYFRLEVPASGTLIVETTGSTDTYGILKNASCADIESDDDDGAGSNFAITRTVTAGTYYVAVRHYSSTRTGAYTLNVRFIAAPPPPADDHGNTCSTATAVTVNHTWGGAINPAGDIDYFRLEVPASGTLIVETTGSTDTYGILKNASCADIESDDDDGAGSNFAITRTVTAGTYYVAVRHYRSTATGAYTLNVSFTPSTPTSDRFTWPVDPTNGTNGHYGVCGEWASSDTRGCYWLSATSEAPATVWRDVQPFQEHFFSTATKEYGYHLGADYNLGGGDSDENRNVYPTAAGTISGVMSNACGYGNIVFVKHTTSFGVYTSMYAHVNWLASGQPAVNVSVTPSNPIALIGKGAWTATASCSSSGSYPAHLHFEIRRGDNRVIGPAYSKPARCDGSDSSSNNCPQREVDPNAFIAAHN